MKLRVTLLAIAAILVASLAANTINIGNAGNTARLLDNTDSGMRMQTTLHNLHTATVNTGRGQYTLLSADGYAWSNKLGQPRLPIVRKIIAVPLGADVTASVVSASEQTIDLAAHGDLAPVMPAQPSLSKSEDPANVPFVMDEAAYAREAWLGDRGVSVEELGVLRGLRLFVVEIRPAEYNPVRNELRVWSDTVVDVAFSGGDYAATENLRARTWSPAFESALGGAVFNYQPLASRDEFTNYPQSMIVVADRMFEPTLQPFLDWKAASGFNLIIAYTDEIGSSLNDISDFIESIWDAATPDNPAPSYLLLVGDTAQIPAFNGSTGDHVTDLNYVRLEGGDFMPEILYSRFSANTVAQLQPQIDKILMYEQYTMPDPSYLGEVVMIAGMDSDHGANWANGQINYGTSNYFNASHGIQSHTYFYPNSGSNAANIISDVSNGVGYVNYTAHGGATSWSDPSFTIPNINSLQNTDEYPLVVGNCCLTNKFEVTECFGEAWLRAEDKGAVGYIGGTNSTYWDEDYWWGVGAGNIVANPTYATTGPGVYDGLFHDHNETFADWHTTAGGMILRGNLAVVEGNGSQNYYWEIYSLMGEGSMQPYMGVPTDNDADWPEQIFIGLTSMDVSADPYSYVALSFDGELMAAGLVDENGDLTLEFDAFDTPGDAQIVITAQNRTPIIDTIGVIPNAGPFVVLDDFTVTGENNGLAEYDETFTLDIGVTNVGADPIFELEASVNTEDPYLVLDTDNVQIGEIAAGGSVDLSGAFSMSLYDNVPDQHEVHLVFTFAGEDASGEQIYWSTDEILYANAPEFTAGMFFVDDASGNNNGVLDPGETAILYVPVTNSGHADSPEATAYFACNNPWLTIEENTVELGALDIAEQLTASYTVAVSEDAEAGTLIPAGFQVTGGPYVGSQIYNIPISVVAEDFENGLELYGWSMGGVSDWFIEGAEVWEGECALRSGATGNSQSSIAEVTIDVVADGEISFYCKVSSEAGYDFLIFSIDGQEQGSWSGEVDWTLAGYDVSIGQHTFTWEYQKDYSWTGGSDCAWIDYVAMPFSGGDPSPIVFLPHDTLNFGEVAVNQTAELPFTIANFGNEELSGSFITIEGFSIVTNDATRKAGDAARASASREVYNFTLPPMGQVDLTIVFAPTVEMDYSGQFTIVSNDPNASEVVIDVTANANVGVSGDPAPEFVTELGGNYPNPFNPETTISFSLATPQRVTIDVYNVLGQRVSRLVDERMDTGEHAVVWRGVDSHGAKVGSGVYFCKMETSNGGRYTAVKKMILLK